MSKAQWHQWLRHTRDEAPSIEEQRYDVQRQAAMKQLAARADERWKSLPSYLDAPKMQQPQPGTVPKDPGGYLGQTEPDERQGVKSAVEDQSKVSQIVEGKDAKEVDEGRFKGKTKEKKTRMEREPAPWEKEAMKRRNPGEDWQPESWMPGVTPRR